MLAYDGEAIRFTSNSGVTPRLRLILLRAQGRSGHVTKSLDRLRSQETCQRVGKSSYSR